MSESLERAHETIHEHASHVDPWARGIAILVSILAAALAMTEIGGKAAQNAYLTHHVALSNDWAFYQAKNLRAVVRNSEADLLASLPNAADPAVQLRITEAKNYATRMLDDPAGGEGMKQIATMAHEKEVVRDEEFHRYHYYEYAGGALEIAIVLASVSVVTRIRALAFGAAAIGGVASLAAMSVAANLF